MEVRKLAYFMPVVTLGTDDQGRQLYQCPGRGCGDTAWFDDDGKGHCPSCEALMDSLAEMTAPLLAELNTGSGT